MLYYKGVINMLSVSERILNAINSKNISYGELSNMTGIPKTTLFKYATGETQKIPLSALTALSEALCISASYLACWSEDPDDYSYLQGNTLSDAKGGIMSNTGERIRQARLNAGLTQRELAEKVGVKFPAIHKYENGLVINLKKSTIENLAKELNVSPAWLLGFEEEVMDTKASNTALTSLLTDDEVELILAYRELNEIGQEKVMDYIADLRDSPKNLKGDNSVQAV